MMLRYYLFRIDLYRRYERSLLWIANHLPKSLVMWCVIRVWANATTGEFSRSPDEVSWGEALRCWEHERGGDRAWS